MIGYHKYLLERARLEDTSKVPNITRIMVKRGYSDEDIKKILGGNHLRVFKQVMV